MDVKKDDWQTNCSDIRERGAYLLRTGVLADCEFLIDGEKIPAHKLILAISSPVFETMFYGSMPLGSSPILVPDVSIGVFKALLNWIYTDKHSLTSFDDICELHYMAKKYMLSVLAKSTLSTIRSMISLQNLSHAYDLAKLFDEEALAAFCLKKIHNQTSRILSDETFPTVDLKWLNTVFSQNTMNIDSELELYNALERYYRVNARLRVEEKSDANGEACDESRKLGDENGIQEVKVENGDNKDVKNPESKKVLKLVRDEELIQSLRPALHQIRFLRMTAGQFAAGPCGGPLLTDKEAFALLLKIANPTATYTLPKDFSTLREKRELPDYMKKNTEIPSSGAWSKSRIVFTVHNFKTRKMTVASNSFYIGKFACHLKVNPEQNGATKKLGVYMCCTHEDRYSSWSCPADVTIRIRSQCPGVPDVVRSFEYEYSSGSSLDRHGFPGLLDWDEACSHYVRCNALVVDATISIHPAARADKVDSSEYYMGDQHYLCQKTGYFSI